MPADNQSKPLEPSSVEERQAAITLKSAKQVAAEIEYLRQQIREAEDDIRERQVIKVKLFDASERLCNLMALAVFQITAGVSTEFHNRLEVGLSELRQKLQQMGAGMLIEKILRIHTRAEAVLKGQPYPLGLATRLQNTFATLMTHVEPFGGIEALAPGEQQLIRATDQAIARLVAMEEELGLLAEIQEEGESAGFAATADD